MKALGKVSQYDKLLAYMRDPDGNDSSLTDHDKHTLDRWLKAHSLCQAHSMSDATAILMKLFPGLSRATAYRDCSNATSMLGDITRSTKEGYRHISLEWIKEAKAIATAERNAKEIKSCGLALAKVGGVNQIDPDTIDWSQVEDHTYEFGLPKEFMAALANIVSAGVVDLADMVNRMGDIAEDAIIVDEGKDE